MLSIFSVAIALTLTVASVQSSPLAPPPTQPDKVGTLDAPLVINDIGDLKEVPAPVGGPLFNASAEELKANNLTKLVIKSDSGTFNIFTYYYNLSAETPIPKYHTLDGNEIDTTFGKMKADIEAAPESDEPKLSDALKASAEGLQREIQDMVDNSPAKPTLEVARRWPDRRQLGEICFIVFSTTVTHTLAATMMSAVEAGRLGIPENTLGPAMVRGFLSGIVAAVGLILAGVIQNMRPGLFARIEYGAAWVFITILRGFFYLTRDTLLDNNFPWQVPTDQEMRDMLAHLWQGQIGALGGNGMIVDNQVALEELGQAAPAA